MSSRDCNSCSNLLRRDGTSQKQRLFEEQQPSYVSIDERSYIDLVQFTLKYAQKIQFWDVFNRRSGDWVTFLENDQAATYTQISTIDLSAFETEFHLHFSTEYTSAAIARDKTIAMIDVIFKMAKKMDEYFQVLDTDLLFHADFENIISRQAAPIIKTLAGYDIGAESQLKLSPSNPHLSFSITDYNELSEFWSVDITTIEGYETIYIGSNIKERGTSAKRHFKTLFESMLDVFDQLKKDVELRFSELLNAYAKHEPHFALFLAFIQLFKHAQNHLNEFTEKHLDFYYRDVLQLSEKDAKPDRVHVILEPAKNVDQKKVEKGSPLEAGTDADGVAISFQTEEEIVVNKATVAKLKSLHLDRGRKTKYIQTIYSSSFANSRDGKGKPFTNPDTAWEPFGSTQVRNGLLLEDQNMETARVGFSIASPEFRMKEGQRKLRLVLDINDSDYGNVFGTQGTFYNFLKVHDVEIDENTDLNNLEGYALLLSNWLTFQFTGEEGWFAPDNISFNGKADITIGMDGDIVGQYITIELTLSKSQAAIVGYNLELHGQNYQTQWPVLEILFNQSATVKSSAPMLAYEFLKDLRLNRVKIESEVEGVTSIKLANDAGNLSAAKPFKPFTSSPQTGSNFYIGSAEIFSKRLTYLSIGLDWKGVPSDSFSDYYKHYQQWFMYSNIGIVQGNSHFAAQIKLLEDFAWKDLSYDVNNERQMYQSSTVALRQSVLTMVAPVSSLLIVALTAIQEIAQMIKVWSWNPIKRDLTTRNFVNLFRDGELEDADVLADGTLDNSNDEDARLPRKIIVKSKDSHPGVAHAQFKNSFDLLTVDEESEDRYQRDPHLVNLENFTSGVKRGYIKLELINDFFHHAYPKLLTERALADSAAVDMPNAPYTPELHKVSLDYKSTFEINYKLGENHVPAWEDRIEQIYHITPFGEVEVLPTQTEKGIEADATDIYYSDRLLPKLFMDGAEITSDGRAVEKIDLDTGRIVTLSLEETSEGSLHIGIENLQTPQSLSLLFQFKEGTEDNDLEVPSVEWCYLSKNQWVAFDSSEIVSDETNGLVNSGIVKFSIPDEATKNNRILGENCHWIRARVIGNTEAFSDLIAVYAQAVSAVYTENGNAAYRLNTPIAGSTISKFVNKDFQIKSVKQPYASFDGRIKEQSNEFYTRVSERLRHKQRGITIRDYEHLVLEEFPEIYKVKCINHTSRYSEYAPGNVSVVVIPFFKNLNEKNPFELKVSKAKLHKINKFLVKLNSPFVNLDVRNPKYETIRVDFGVEFHIGYDRTYYVNQLNEDIKQFLSPWAFGAEEDIIFGGKMNRSIILNFIEERSYVDYVTQFRMFHRIDENRAEKEVFVAEGTTASSVLVTAPNHNIHPASCIPQYSSSSGVHSFDQNEFDESYD